MSLGQLKETLDLALALKIVTESLSAIDLVFFVVAIYLGVVWAVPQVEEPKTETALTS